EKYALEEAAAAYRRAAEFKPDLAAAYLNLGLVLRQSGRYREALDALRQAHALGSRQQNWRHPTAEMVRRGEREVELESKLPAWLRGEYRPTPALEMAEMGCVCKFKGHFSTSARLYEEAFAAVPDPLALQDPHLFVAACAAARAGCGHDKHEPLP